MRERDRYENDYNELVLVVVVIVVDVVVIVVVVVDVVVVVVVVVEAVVVIVVVGMTRIQTNHCVHSKHDNSYR